MKHDGKGSIVSRAVDLFHIGVKFLFEDIWRITETEVSGMRRVLIRLTKTVIISVRRFNEDGIQTKASALTYNTLLAIVPVLALLFAIARGFGFQNIIQSQLFDYFPAQREALTHAFNFVDQYLQQAKSGVFVGVGLLLLLWTVVSMINNIESVFNEIWQIKKSRSFYRKMTDYTSLFLILPLLMIASSGISLFLTANISSSGYLSYLSPLLLKLLSFSPYLLTWLIFTGMYVFIPNTRVKFINALLAGILCGSAFQLFQFLYLSGQMWVSKYNAIYGSFAFLPLLLLWIQLSWLICLFGAVLTFSSQSIRNYDFEQDSKNISRRFRDFLIIAVATVIVKRFDRGQTPLTVEEISFEYKIPIKLTASIVNQLIQIGVVSETFSENDELVLAYQPAVDIGKLSVGYLMTKVDEEGSENFKIDKILFHDQWSALMEIRKRTRKEADVILLKDLELEPFSGISEQEK